MACLCKYTLLTKQNVKYNFLKAIFKNPYILYQSRNVSNLPIEYSRDKDPAPLYFNKDVQNILKNLTRININKIFEPKKLETKQLEPPTYKFMTDDELKEALENAAERANELLQMPPVIKVYEPVNETLSRDPALQGNSPTKFVFTDITYGVSNRNRVIVIREPNGDLVKADWNTRHRMNQIYFPQPGRELHTPRMFSDEYFKNILERKEYVFVLDRACVQFEPDDPMYQRITSLTYQHVNEHNDFELLRSTRHFGPFVFYLVWFKTIDNLLLELIETAHVKDANSLIELHNKLHKNEAIGPDVILKSDDDLTLIQKYIVEKSALRAQLQLALQSYKELLKQKTELEQGIKQAHGFV